MNNETKKPLGNGSTDPEQYLQSKGGSKDKPKNDGKGKNNGKPKDRDKNGNGDGKPKEKGFKNDKKFYAHNPELTSAVSSIPWNTVLGKPRILAGYAGANSVDYTIDNRTVLGVGVTPTPGYSEDDTSAINVAAKNQYAYIRTKISGNYKNYQKSDLGIYFLCMDSGYMWYYHLVKMYSLINEHDAANRQIPYAFFQAVGWDYDDFSSNAANFRALINKFGAQLSALYVPAGMDYFNRHKYLMLNIWKENNTPRSHYVIAYPHALWNWSGKTDSHGTEARPFISLPKAGGVATFEEISTITNSFLDHLLNDDDIGLITGDIERAYDSFIELPAIPEFIQPSYLVDNESWLQWHNTFVFDGSGLGYQLVDTEDWRIYQEGNSIRFGGELGNVVDQYSMPEECLVDVNYELTDPLDVAEVTRGCIAVTSSSSSGFRFTCGSEIFITMALCNGFSNIIKFGSVGRYPSDITNISDVMLRIHVMEHADMYPRLYIKANANSTEKGFVFGDLDKFAIIPASQLAAIHDACILSLLDVPRNRKF